MSSSSRRSKTRLLSSTSTFSKKRSVSPTASWPKLRSSSRNKQRTSGPLKRPRHVSQQRPRTLRARRRMKKSFPQLPKLLPKHQHRHLHQALLHTHRASPLQTLTVALLQSWILHQERSVTNEGVAPVPLSSRMLVARSGDIDGHRQVGMDKPKREVQLVREHLAALKRLMSKMKRKSKMQRVNTAL